MADGGNEVSPAGMDPELIAPPGDTQTDAMEFFGALAMTAGPFVEQFMKNEQEKDRLRNETEQLRIREQANIERLRIEAMKEDAKSQAEIEKAAIINGAATAKRRDLWLIALSLSSVAIGIGLVVAGKIQEGALFISHSSAVVAGYLAGTKKGGAKGA